MAEEEWRQLVKKNLLTPEVYAKAADLIEEHGLSHGAYYHPREGCYCTIGAMAVAAGLAQVGLGVYVDGPVGLRGDDAHLIADHVAKTLALPGDGHDRGWVATTGWNDSSTKEEVVAALRAVAAK